VHQATLFEGPDEAAPGRIALIDGRLVVATGKAWLALERAQLAGKTAQTASELLRNPSFAEGARLGTPISFQLPDRWIVPAGEAI
jgi:methionyl-tRNA formyltransferase